MKNLPLVARDVHKLSPFASHLKEIVYGGNDGIVTTFAVVSGFAGASQTGQSSLVVATVLLFGFANLFADATSMGLGNFLSERSERDVYESEKEKKLQDVAHNSVREIADTMRFLKNKGYSEKDAQALTHLFAKNPDYWAELMMRFELGMDRGSDQPILNAFATFSSFIVFGAIPLLPYLLVPMPPQDLFVYSCFAAGGALLLLGVLRWHVSKIRLIRSLTEALFIGSLASLIAYGVGTFFS